MVPACNFDFYGTKTTNNAPKTGIRYFYEALWCAKRTVLVK